MKACNVNETWFCMTTLSMVKIMCAPTKAYYWVATIDTTSNFMIVHITWRSIFICLARKPLGPRINFWKPLFDSVIVSILSKLTFLYFYFLPVLETTWYWMFKFISLFFSLLFQTNKHEPFYRVFPWIVTLTSLHKSGRYSPWCTIEHSNFWPCTHSGTMHGRT
jgi:hypothetical protein